MLVLACCNIAQDKVTTAASSSSIDQYKVLFLPPCVQCMILYRDCHHLSGVYVQGGDACSLRY